MKNPIRLKLLIVALAIFVCLAVIKSKEASAYTFYPTFFRLQQFSFNISKLKLTGIVRIGFNTALLASRISESPKVYGDCEHEYERCVGYIDQFDDSMEYLLLQAKNACVYSGESPKEKCFGLDIEAPEPEDVTEPFVIPEPKPIQCTGPETRSCTTVTGLPGIQKARSCDTTTGEWNFGLCVAEFIPPPPPPPAPQCNADQPQCAVGYSGNYLCQNGQWVNNCYLPTCQGSAPTCQAGYTGIYVCQNSQWVSQCQKVSSCPVMDPDWRVCVMSDGRWGREYTSYCNESTGQWVWKSCNVYPALQPVCTSFTYSEWDACSMGTQGRTILTRAPYGCAGGSPVTTQSCLVKCTSFTYSDWSTCVNDSQTRQVLSASPTNCTGGDPVTQQRCTSYDCLYFTYTDWSTCVNRVQTRKVIVATPKYCTGGNPVTEQSCR